MPRKDGTMSKDQRPEADVNIEYQLTSKYGTKPWCWPSNSNWLTFILSIKDLELASLQLIPTYTFPANPTAWPTREVVSAIASHISPAQAELPTVRVVGEHPYSSGLVLTYQSVLSGTPITSHGPFTRSDPVFWDFSVLVCGPEGKYGPLD